MMFPHIEWYKAKNKNSFGDGNLRYQCKFTISSVCCMCVYTHFYVYMPIYMYIVHLHMHLYVYVHFYKYTHVYCCVYTQAYFACVYMHMFPSFICRKNNESKITQIAISKPTSHHSSLSWSRDPWIIDWFQHWAS